MDRTLEDAIELANKQREELPHIVQVVPSDYDRIIMADRIAELEQAVKMLTELWTKEREYHNETQMRFIEVSKMIMGIKE